MSFLVILLVLWVEKFSAWRLRIQQDGPWLEQLRRLQRGSLQGARLPAPDREHLTVGFDLERAEDAKVHCRARPYHGRGQLEAKSGSLAGI